MNNQEDVCRKAPAKPVLVNIFLLFYFLFLIIIWAKEIYIVRKKKKLKISFHGSFQIGVWIGQGKGVTVLICFSPSGTGYFDDTVNTTSFIVHK